MRPHCSSMPKIIAFTTLDGASFWVKNAKRKHLLAFKTLNGNALSHNESDSDTDKYEIFNFSLQHQIIVKNNVTLKG